MLRILLPAFLLPAIASAYPILAKITNTRSNVIFLHSEAQKKSIEILPKTSEEILIFENSDWRVKYKSGAYGMTAWNFDQPLQSSIEKVGLEGERPNEATLKVVSLELQEVTERTFIETARRKPWDFKLVVTHVFDTTLDKKMFGATCALMHGDSCQNLPHNYVSLLEGKLSGVSHSSNYLSIFLQKLRQFMDLHTKQEPNALSLLAPLAIPASAAQDSSTLEAPKPARGRTLERQ